MCIYLTLPSLGGGNEPANGLFVTIPSLSHSIPEIRPVVMTVTISLRFPCKLGQCIVSLATPLPDAEQKSDRRDRLVRATMAPWRPDPE